MTLRIVVAAVVGVGIGFGIGLGLHPVLIRLDGDAAANALRKFYLPRYDVGARPDAELVALFQAHRPEFDQLARMASEDLKSLVAEGIEEGFYVELLPWPKGVADHSFVDVERAEEYRRLLSTIGIRCSLSAGRDPGHGDAPLIWLVDSRVA
jgi:hypothetical protein